MSKYSEWFELGSLRADLKGRSVRGGFYSFVTQASVFVLRLGSTAVLARYLVPEQFGLISMVTAFTHFADQFRDLGLSQATIQRKDLTHEHVSTMFWLNVAIGLILTLAVAGAAPVMAWFYKEPALTRVAVALSVGFLFNGLNVQHQALLQRQLYYGRLVAVDISSVGLSSLVAMIWAVNGGGYWALVAMNLSYPLVRAAALYIACSWRPGRGKWSSEVFSMIRFGAHVSGFNILNYFSRNLDAVLIGKFCGTVCLGNYSRAYSMLLFPLSQLRSPIVNVGIPALASLQHEPERYRRYFLRVLNLMAILSIPLVVFMIVCTPELVRLLLGERWGSVVPIFRVLGLVALLQPYIAVARGLPLLSLGQGKRYFYFGVVSSAVTVVGFSIGIHWGVMGVAWSYVGSYYIVAFLTTKWCLGGSSVTARETLEVLIHPVLFALLAAIPVLHVRQMLTPYIHPGVWGSLELLLVSATVFGLVLVGLLWFWPGARSRYGLEKGLSGWRNLFINKEK